MQQTQLHAEGRGLAPLVLPLAGWRRLQPAVCGCRARTLSGSSSPAARRRVVDLPVPLLPMMPTASPRRILKVAPRRMCLLQAAAGGGRWHEQQ